MKLYISPHSPDRLIEWKQTFIFSSCDCYGGCLNSNSKDSYTTYNGNGAVSLYGSISTEMNDPSLSGDLQVRGICLSGEYH